MTENKWVLPALVIGGIGFGLVLVLRSKPSPSPIESAGGLSIGELVPAVLMEGSTGNSITVTVTNQSYQTFPDGSQVPVAMSFGLVAELDFGPLGTIFSSLALISENLSMQAGQVARVTRSFDIPGGQGYTGEAHASARLFSIDGTRVIATSNRVDVVVGAAPITEAATVVI